MRWIIGILLVLEAGKIARAAAFVLGFIVSVCSSFFIVLLSKLRRA